MPDIERSGVIISEKAQVAAASAPIARAMLRCYELWHPELAEPIRFVDDKADLLATLEADAPRDAGEEVEFMACPLSSQRAEESESAAAPITTLGRPDVAGLLLQATDAARESTEPWGLIERVYASDDTSTPALLPPLKLEMLSSQLAGSEGGMEFGFDDDNDQDIPAQRFIRREYPGLMR